MLTRAGIVGGGVMPWGADLHGDYILPTPVLLDGYEADTSYTLTGAGASKALDTTNEIQGNGCMLLTGPSTDNVTVGITKSYGTLDLATMGGLAFYAKRLTAGSVDDYSMRLQRATPGLLNVGDNDSVQFLAGGRFVSAHASEFTGPYAEGAGTLTGRVSFRQVGTTPAQVAFDAWYYNAEGRPTFIPWFDDARAETYDNVYALMAARGFVGTITVPTTFVDTAGYMTLAQLQELYALGWDMVPGSTTDVAFTSFGSEALALADFNTGRDYLTTNGIDRAKNHGVWPSGSFTQALADAFAADGVLTMRNTEPQSFHSRFGVGPGVRHTLPSQGTATSVSYATVKAKVDQTILRGNTQCIHFHDISDTPSSIGWSLANFTDLLDYLKTLYNANTVEVMTVSEWWDRDGAATVPA